MLLFVFWECCCLCIGKDVVICVLGMSLLFLYWECCCYMGNGNAVVACIGNAVFICILGMLLLFG